MGWLVGFFMGVVKATKLPVVKYCHTKVVDLFPKTGNMFFSFDIGMHVLEIGKGE